MTWYSVLLPAHVILTTAGYAGLIATNAWLLILCRAGDATAVAGAVTTWRKVVRIFGPLLGAGVLAGFALALFMGMPLSAAWLVACYALVVVAIGAQAALVVPWQLRAAAGRAVISTGPIVVTLSLFCVVYVGIVSLMLLKP